MFLHKRFYTKKPFTHRRPLHKETFHTKKPLTQRQSCAPSNILPIKAVHTKKPVTRNFYTQKLFLQGNPLPKETLYTKNSFTHRKLHAKKHCACRSLLGKETFHTKQLLAQRSLTQRCFYTQTSLWYKEVLTFKIEPFDTSDPCNCHIPSCRQQPSSPTFLPSEQPSLAAFPSRFPSNPRRTLSQRREKCRTRWNMREWNPMFFLQTHQNGSKRNNEPNNCKTHSARRTNHWILPVVLRANLRHATQTVWLTIEWTLQIGTNWCEGSSWLARLCCKNWNLQMFKLCWGHFQRNTSLKKWRVAKTQQIQHHWKKWQQKNKGVEANTNSCSHTGTMAHMKRHLGLDCSITAWNLKNTGKLVEIQRLNSPRSDELAKVLIITITELLGTDLYPDGFWGVGIGNSSNNPHVFMLGGRSSGNAWKFGMD